MEDENHYKKIRKQLKLSIEELAAAISEEQGYIWLLENGYPHKIDPKILERIIKKLEDLHDEKRMDLL